MDESRVQPPPERPLPEPSTPGPEAIPPTGLDDPRALQVLTTEHWSLLSARALAYNETFARAGMFVTFPSATLVALGLVSTGTGFNRDLVVVAIAVLGVDLFVGLATMGRVASHQVRALLITEATTMLSEFLAVTTLVVTDVDRAKGFYKERLGLTLLEESPSG